MIENRPTTIAVLKSASNLTLKFSKNNKIPTWQVGFEIA